MSVAFDPNTDTSQLKIDPVLPVENPPGTSTAMSYSNAGILVFGAAALIFCLWELRQAFLIALLVVLALALGNLILLSRWRARAGAYTAATAGEAERAVAMMAAAAATAAAAAIRAAASEPAPAQGSEQDRMRAAG